ncbi:regulatory protein RecX [Streptodolium elevatio]
MAGRRGSGDAANPDTGPPDGVAPGETKPGGTELGETGADGAGRRTREARGTTTRGSGRRVGGLAGSGRGDAYENSGSGGDGDGAFGESTDGSAARPGGRRRGRRGRDDAGEPGGRRRERRIGPAQIDPDEDPEAQARAICLRQLTGQPRTRAQLADAMKRRGVPDDVAEHVLGRFTEVKLIDDAAFAAAWVDTRHIGRGLARRALAQELRQRGVDSALVSEAVERLDPEQELATARALVERRIPSTRRLDRQVRMRRLAGMLARKGYGEGLALRVVREALDADEAWQREAEDDDGWAHEPFGADDTPPEPED